VGDTVIIGGKELDGSVNKIVQRDNSTRIRYGKSVDQEIILHHYPFKIEFLKGNNVEVVLNERNFFNVEHWRTKKPQEEQVVSEPKETEQNAENETEEVKEEKKEDSTEDEAFNGKTDSRPRGISLTAPLM
jgi:mannosyl-oligosaccharide alpha-1,3-glucosidase